MAPTFKNRVALCYYLSTWVNVRASLESVVSHQEIPVIIHNVLTRCKKKKKKSDTFAHFLVSPV